ncbi:MAG: hypothetical protein KKG09_08890 [Verrucomicrobia bacterium]|nr:hypothetical protein [Verrucomicrobiota bacterium]MBU4248563.1 hypothetical protein [Verrucomicrobiota bacterium]MBU4291933.1 hypothetical protein [Verrucomicrobiota bacterium]MBU4498105.1 hypothetical protein [Verrucomicrobiota bacterium]MCG2679356.1 hypothetical protein [Kiritimatiellia bacterium]
MATYLIGLDIGTSKLSAVALEVGGAKRLVVEQIRNSASLPGEPDAAEQDAEMLLGAALSLLRTLTRRPELTGARPLALGVTGQMHGVVLVDRDGRPLSSLIDWRDARGCRFGTSSGRSYVETFAARIGSQALEDCGCRPASGYGGVTLLRLAEEGNLPGHALALTIHALMVRRLCGRAVVGPSDAAGWCLGDVRKGTGWIPGIAEALGFRSANLPEMAPTGSQAGALLPESADASGLPAGLPVAVALGDNQASFIGSTPRLGDTLLMNLGTGGQMSVPTGCFCRVDGLDTRPLVNGQWLLVGASLCGGRAYEILNTFFLQVGRELFSAPAPAPERLYDIMNCLAARADDDCGGIRARTLFTGSRLDPMARGSFEGITAANLTPANLTRALIRGMVEELVGFYRQAGAAGAHAALLLGAGNAVRNNPVVRQEMESQLGMKLCLPPWAEEAAVGAALTGGLAAGVYPDWVSAGRDLLVVP